MSSDYCSSPLCKGSTNCPGCFEDGQINCYDTRCQPNCRSCEVPSSYYFNGNIVFTILLFTLLTILFVLWFVYGPGFFEQHSDHERAKVIVPKKSTLKVEEK
jgi:hypothetical protein